MNEHEAERIAAAMHAARPDWPARSLLTLIRKNLMDRPRRDVFVALAWVASEPATSSPARVLESGPWWLAAGVDGQTTGRREPYDRGSFCATCGEPEHRCHLKWADDHEFESVAQAAARTESEKAADALAYAREAVAESKATGPREAEERAHKPSPQVAAIRAAAGNETTEAAAAAESETA